MQLFDTHFHYYGEQSPRDYYDAINFPAEGRLLAVGADYPESLKAAEFAEAIANASFAAGVHPHAATKYLADNAPFDRFREQDKLVAIGEIGLDFYYENSARRDQYIVMEKFLSLALDWQLPAIIHCRDRDDQDAAYQDCFALLQDFATAGGRFVVHSFTGTAKWLEKFLELGAMIGVNGIVTFPRAANVRELLPLIPNDRLLLETDAPYLAPVPHRGKSNHPGLLIHVAERVAEIKGMETAELAEMTFANGCRLFSLV